MQPAHDLEFDPQGKCETVMGTLEKVNLLRTRISGFRLMPDFILKPKAPK